MSNERIKEEIEKCKKQGMPDFMIEDHINDLIMEEEYEKKEKKLKPVNEFANKLRQWIFSQTRGLSGGVDRTYDRIIEEINNQIEELEK